MHTRVPFHGLFLDGFSYPAHSEVVPAASSAPHVHVLYAQPLYVVPKKDNTSFTSPLPLWSV